MKSLSLSRLIRDWPFQKVFVFGALALGHDRRRIGWEWYRCTGQATDSDRTREPGLELEARVDALVTL